MTSITLPLKKIPGQRPRFPTFFGGRKITAPAVLLSTTPFTLYLYIRLGQGNPLSYNLIGLLPYIWGLVSIASYMMKSSRTMEMMIEVDLDEAEEIFMESREYFRKLLTSNIVFSIILTAVFSYYLITKGGTLLFITGLISVASIGIALSSILRMYDWKSTLDYFILAFAFESVFLIFAFNGPVWLALIFPASSVSMMDMILRGIKEYDLRSFFERMIN
jgi:hypothetical protein